LITFGFNFETSDFNNFLNAAIAFAVSILSGGGDSDFGGDSVGRGGFLISTGSSLIVVGLARLLGFGLGADASRLDASVGVVEGFAGTLEGLTGALEGLTGALEGLATSSGAIEGFGFAGLPSGFATGFITICLSLVAFARAFGTGSGGIFGVGVFSIVVFPLLATGDLLLVKGVFRVVDAVAV
jgi:hypothetical protein